MTDGVAGQTGEQIELLLALRKIEELWQKGFEGSITLHIGNDRGIKFETRTFERLGTDRRSTARDGEDRRRPK